MTFHKKRNVKSLLWSSDQLLFEHTNVLMKMQAIGIYVIILDLEQTLKTLPSSIV